MLLVDLQIAARNLARHTKRNLFLGGAIAGVTMLLVLMGALTAGIRSAMFESATTLMTGHVNVGGFYKVTSGSGAPIVTDAPKVMERARARVPELDYATARVRGYAKVVADRASMDMVLGGIDIETEPHFRKVVRLVSGNLDELGKPDTFLIFEDQAKRLEVGVGDVVTLSAPTWRGVNNTADLRIVAIGKNIGLLSSWNGFMRSETLRKLYQLRPDTTGAVHLYLKDPSRAGAVSARLREDLGKDGFRMMEADPQPYWMKFQKVNSEEWTGQKLDVTTWEDELSFMSWVLSGLNGLTGLLVFVLLVIVVVGILNTLAIAIRERTREIGTLRAIGMQRRKVLWLFLLETLLLGIAGTVAGALLGWGIGGALNAANLSAPESVQMFLLQQHLHLAVSFRTVLLQVLFITGVTTVASLFPALRAARLAPVTAMHHVG
jgi:ABC-type lipoprotein release transport system permease subunit